MASLVKMALLLVVLLFAIALAESKGNLNERKNGSGSLQSSQCPGQCSRRCSQTQYKKPCLFFCNKCCNACLCVPTGYYGNKGECPCYNNWKTKRGGPKCP